MTLVAEQPERSTGIDQDASRSQPVHLKIFVSLSTFLSAFKEVEGFRWDDECEKAFQDLKEYLVRVPMLNAPKPERNYSCTSRYPNML